MVNYYLDANGTNGTDPALIDRVYQDGTRIASNDTKAIAAKEATDDARLARVRKLTDGTASTLSAIDTRDAIRALAELQGVEL